MSLSASQLLPLIVLLPALGALINGLLGSKMSRRAVHIVGVGSVGLAFILGIRAFSALMRIKAGGALDPNIANTVYTWGVSGMFQFDVAFYLDPLSAVLLMVVTGVGLLIHIYSMGYMSHDDAYARYFAYLNLFMFSMLLLILGKNLLMLFVGWEGVGLCSYLLIGFWFSDDAKAQAGQKAFVVNRIGDVGFVIGICLILFHTGGTTDYDVLKWSFAKGGFGPFFDSGTLMACCLLLFLGACGKSAQIPLYVWLPDAMAGPTPVSALIHAATMVTAGVYMIARMSFMYTLSPAAMAVVATVGACTAIFAAIIALTQRDIKKVLAYSTVSQLGYMVLAVGVGAYVAGVFHLMTHAFFKALLFLGAGSVIHGMHGKQDIFEMGGLKKKMPITRITFLIGCLAIAGVPLLSGFFSKDEILWETMTKRQALELPERAGAVWSDGQSAIVAGSAGLVLLSEGENWRQEQVPPAKLTRARDRSSIVGAPTIGGVTKGADGTVWAVGDGASIYRLSGQGHFEKVYQPTDEPGAADLRSIALRGVLALGANDVWAVGERGLAIHFDGQKGAIHRVEPRRMPNLHAVVALPNGRVVACGAGCYTFDGNAWGPSASPKQTVTGLARVGNDVLASVTEGGGRSGALLKLQGTEWSDASPKVPGVAAITNMTAVVGIGDALYAVGQARFGGETAQPTLFTYSAAGWTAQAGEEGVMALGVFVLGNAPRVTAVGRKLLAAEGGKLAGGAVLPYKPWIHKWLLMLAMIAAVLTAFYMFRLYILTFEGERRCDDHTWETAHESPLSMTGPLMILAFLSVVGGYVGTPLFGHSTELLQHWLEPVFRVADTRLVARHDTGAAWTAALASAGLAFLGIGLAWAMYMLGKGAVPKRLAETLKPLYTLVNNKFYVDELYDLIVIRPFRFFARVAHKVIDAGFIDRFLVHGPGRVLLLTGRALRPLQNGQVQQYAVLLVIGIAALAWMLGV